MKGKRGRSAFPLHSNKSRRPTLISPFSFSLSFSSFLFFYLWVRLNSLLCSLYFPSSSSFPISFEAQLAGNFSVGEPQMRFAKRRILAWHPINQRARECTFSSKPYRSIVTTSVAAWLLSFKGGQLPSCRKMGWNCSDGVSVASSLVH